MPLSTVPIRLPAGSTSADACVVAPVCASQQGGTRSHPASCSCVTCEFPADHSARSSISLPSSVPPSDVLWRLLLGGYSYAYVSGLPCSHPDKPVLLARAQKLWDLIRHDLTL